MLVLKRGSKQRNKLGNLHDSTVTAKVLSHFMIKESIVQAETARDLSLPHVVWNRVVSAHVEVCIYIEQMTQNSAMCQDLNLHVAFCFLL